MEDQTNKPVTGWVGWITFASIMLIASGVLQGIYGVAAIMKQSWYILTTNAGVVLNITTWGWVSLFVGVLLVIAGLAILRGSLFGRSVGIYFVVIGLLANLALLTVAPIWSVIALAAYALTGYAIVAHGGEMKILTHTGQH